MKQQKTNQTDSNIINKLRIFTKRQLTISSMLRVEKRYRPKEISPFSKNSDDERQKIHGDSFTFKGSFRDKEKYVFVIQQYDWTTISDLKDSVEQQRTQYHKIREELMEYNLDGQLTFRKVSRNYINSYGNFWREKSFVYDPPGSFLGKRLGIL